jgi:hypothetical protein
MVEASTVEQDSTRALRTYAGELPSDDLCVGYGAGFLHAVRDGSLDAWFICAVLLNAVWIGIQTEYRSWYIGEVVPEWSRYVDLSFCLVFSYEVVIRLCVLRGRFFKVDVMWNIFDIVIVLMQWLDWAVETFGSSAGDGVTQSSALRILRLARIARALRFVRLINLMVELKALVHAIFNSMKSVMWTLLMLGLVAFIVGIFITDSFVVVRKTWKDDDELTTARHDALCYWGTLHRSMLSLYAAITGGHPWHTLLSPLMSEVSPWLAAPFILYITFCVFGLRNIITGVFCSNAADSIDRENTVDIAKKYLFRVQSSRFGCIWVRNLGRI